MAAQPMENETRSQQLANREKKYIALILNTC